MKKTLMDRYAQIFDGYMQPSANPIRLLFFRKESDLTEKCQEVCSIFGILKMGPVDFMTASFKKKKNIYICILNI